MPGYARERLGVQRHYGGEVTARHRHRTPYAAIILGGGYEEAGEGGRQETDCGTVMLHGPFDAHQNRFSRTGAEVLNLPLPWTVGTLSATGRCDDLNYVVKLAHRDRIGAAALLLKSFTPEATDRQDWPDMLADAIIADPALGLGEWSRRHNLSPSIVSRQFGQVYGTPPKRFRAEARARQAWRAIISTEVPFVQIALELGFADQAHLTRSVVALTGFTPSGWRCLRTSRFKTALVPGCHNPPFGWNGEGFDAKHCKECADAGRLGACLCCGPGRGPEPPWASVR